MNSFIVRLFVFITEVLSGIIIALVVIAGIIAMLQGKLLAGVAIAVGGTVLIAAIFGFAAVFIEIHKDLRALRAHLIQKEKTV